MKKLQIDAKIDNLNDVISFIDNILDDTNCTFKQRFAIEEAVEEIFVNIAKYAYPVDGGDAIIEVNTNIDPHYIQIIFIDQGIQYNPLEKEDPNFNIPLADRQIGGLGIYMVKNLMDNIEYEYDNQQNKLTIIKYLGESENR